MVSIRVDGIINVYKEAGFTSHDVVAKLRGILRQKKIGHTGTLDPDAVGVLPVCLGKATKVCELLTNEDKSYHAVCRLGIETDTQDISGKVLRTCDYSMVTEERLCNIICSFIGESEQIPPMYSALKVNGKKLYELAREGKTVERKPRKITISDIQLSEIDLSKGSFAIDVTCSKGTYIRTLCHDIGQALGTVSAMEHLVRTRVSIFRLEDAMKLSEIEAYMQQSQEILLAKMIPIDALFPEYPRYQINSSGVPLLHNGNRLPIDALDAMKHFAEQEQRPGKQILVYDETGRFRAIYEFSGSDYKVIKMF